MVTEPTEKETSPIKTKIDRLFETHSFHSTGGDVISYHNESEDAPPVLCGGKLMGLLKIVEVSLNSEVSRYAVHCRTVIDFSSETQLFFECAAYVDENGIEIVRFEGFNADWNWVELDDPQTATQFLVACIETYEAEMNHANST